MRNYFSDFDMFFTKIKFNVKNILSHIKITGLKNGILAKAKRPNTENAVMHEIKASLCAEWFFLLYINNSIPFTAIAIANEITI